MCRSLNIHICCKDGKRVEAWWLTVTGESPSLTLHGIEQEQSAERGRLKNQHFKCYWIVQLLFVNPITMRHFRRFKLLVYKCLNYAQYKYKHFYYASKFEDHQ